MNKQTNLYTNRFQLPIFRSKPLWLLPIRIEDDNEKSRKILNMENNKKALVILTKKSVLKDGNIFTKEDKQIFNLHKKSSVLGKMILLFGTLFMFFLFSMLYFSINKDNFLKYLTPYILVLLAVLSLRRLRDLYKNNQIWKYSYLVFLIIGIFWLAIDFSISNFASFLYLTAIWILWEKIIFLYNSKVNMYSYNHNDNSFFLIEQKSIYQ